MAQKLQNFLKKIEELTLLTKKHREEGYPFLNLGRTETGFWKSNEVARIIKDLKEELQYCLNSIEAEIERKIEYEKQDETKKAYSIINDAERVIAIIKESKNNGDQDACVFERVKSEGLIDTGFALFEAFKQEVEGREWRRTEENCFELENEKGEVFMIVPEHVMDEYEEEIMLEEEKIILEVKNLYFYIVKIN